VAGYIQQVFILEESFCSEDGFEVAKNIRSIEDIICREKDDFVLIAPRRCAQSCRPQRLRRRFLLLPCVTQWLFYLQNGKLTLKMEN